jgi:hypothetical protein
MKILDDVKLKKFGSKIVSLKKQKKRKECYSYFLDLFVNAKVPSAHATNATAKTAITAEEYSGIVTVLAVGTKNACTAIALVGIVKSRLLVV